MRCKGLHTSLGTMGRSSSLTYPIYIAGEWNGIPRGSHNPEIAGSTPVPATKCFLDPRAKTVDSQSADSEFESPRKYLN